MFRFGRFVGICIWHEEFHFRGRSLRGPMGAGEEPVFGFHLNNQVNEKLTIDGVNSAHYTRFMFGDHQLLAC